MKHEMSFFFFFFILCILSENTHQMSMQWMKNHTVIKEMDFFFYS